MSRRRSESIPGTGPNRSVPHCSVHKTPMRRKRGTDVGWICMTCFSDHLKGVGAPNRRARRQVMFS